MKIYLVKDATGNLYGYRLGYTNYSFAPENDMFYTSADKSAAEYMCAALNKPQLNLALPITVLEIELP